MSDLMLLGVLQMPIEMVMSSELSTLQYVQRGHEAAARIKADAVLIEQQAARIAELEARSTEPVTLRDEWIELYALRHIAPHADKFKSTFGLGVPYQQTEQFRRVKAYTHAVIAHMVPDSAMAKDAESIWCQSCGDGITAHDPGICGNCFAMKHSGSALALLRRIPTTPDQMIDFIGNQYMSMAPCEEDGSYAGHPSEVEYTLSVHDLLSAFQWADLDKDSIDAAIAASAEKNTGN